ncbi:MAG: hypothetical protein A2Y62_10910 [Candidatus Fischerbacteria bacterium RBG_13_37_8]|uniref:DUF2723 domain-containing protein n=1 Tax=Candidatus Fischerbacteria bacterium RBG_13_37_8 TaxID=1817863 RepID=A0A1F5VUI8_9BACT|nr:MAG: hypothetical protein A2Y62_10910 [Candidatus Fischerbacteria bacterium RBG_13_37_8]
MDSGELITAVYFSGVAHPPGFPAYLLIAHPFSRIPLGNVAWRINFVSALFAALSVLVLFLTTVKILEIYTISLPQKKKNPPKKKSAEPLPSHSFLIPAIISSLAFALSHSFWSYAEIAEVYSMNLFFVLLTAFFLIANYRTKIITGHINYRILYLSAFLYGVSLGIHHVTVVLVSPALFLLMFSTTGVAFLKSKKFLFALLTFFTGLSVYSYLFIAAANDPVMNWGNPDTWERFARHVSAWQYRSNISINFSQVLNELSSYLHLQKEQFYYIFLLFILLGIFQLFKQRILTLFLLLLVFFNLLYGLLYTIAEDKDAYYLPTYAFESILIAVAIFTFSSAKSTIKRNITTLIAVLSLVFLFVSNYATAPKNDYRIADKYVLDTVNSIEQNGVYLTQDWQIYSPLFYHQHINNLRQDILSIDINLLKRSWYLHYIKKQYPEAAQFFAKRIEDFLKEVMKFERGLPYDPLTIQQCYINLINSFIEYAHKNNHIAYLGLITEEGIAPGLKRIPTGLAFSVFPYESTYVTAPGINIEELLKPLYAKDQVVQEKVIPFYASMLTSRGIYLNRLRKHYEATQLYLESLKLKEDKKTLELLADSYLFSGNKKNATVYYEQLIKQYGSSPSIEQKLRIARD